MSQPLADILRLEGKHHGSLVHIVYWAARDPSPLRIQQQSSREYTDAFKATAVRLSEVPGVSVQDVAALLYIHPFMLSRWRRPARSQDNAIRCSLGYLFIAQSSEPCLGQRGS
ncbi:transposase [Lysobacter olei]